MELTQERLKQLLEFDPSSGIFRWKVRRKYQSPIGSIAGWHSGKNAWRIEIERKNYLAHRLAWFYVHGVWPKQIDHINGNRSDNRFCNLRPANNSQNQANMGPKSNNRLGIRGVSFRRGKYLVQLRKNQKHIRAEFKKLDNAVLFATLVSKCLHGEFSIHNRT